MAIAQVLLSSVLNRWQKKSIDIQDNVTVGTGLKQV